MTKTFALAAETLLRVRLEPGSVLDEGTLVLSNMRIAFIGKLKSVVTQLPKLVHIESYNDALAVFQEGRESPNFYKISAPQYFLFYVNWILDHNG